MIHVVQNDCFMDGIGYWGEDAVVSHGIVDRPEDCQVACYVEPECSVWSYQKSEQLCSLKKFGNDSRNDAAYISGPKACEGGWYILS